MFTRIGGISTLILVVCLLAATVAQAGTITVANTNDSGAGSLRAALAEAAPGETIILPAGEYTLASELSIDKSVTIDGAGASTTTVQAGGAFRVLNMDAAGEDVKIAGLTIRGGEAQPSSVDGAEGGGVLDEGIDLRALPVPAPQRYFRHHQAPTNHDDHRSRQSIQELPAGLPGLPTPRAFTDAKVMGVVPSSNHAWTHP